MLKSIFSWVDERNIANNVGQEGYKVAATLYPGRYFVSRLLYYIGNISLSTRYIMDLSMDVGDIIIWQYDRNKEKNQLEW